MIDESVKERLRTLTVETILAIRAAYLSTPVANALTHWSQLQERVRASARRSTTVEQWATAMARAMRLPAPSATFSDALMALSHEVRERGCAVDWLRLVDDEYAFLMAMARAVAERRKEEMAP